MCTVFDGVEKRAKKTTSNRVLRRIIFMNVGNILIRLGMINRLLIYAQFVAMHMKFFVTIFTSTVIRASDESGYSIFCPTDFQIIKRLAKT